MTPYEQHLLDLEALILRHIEGLFYAQGETYDGYRCQQCGLKARENEVQPQEVKQ